MATENSLKIFAPEAYAFANYLREKTKRKFIHEWLQNQEKWADLSGKQHSESAQWHHAIALCILTPDNPKQQNALRQIYEANAAGAVTILVFINFDKPLPTHCQSDFADKILAAHAENCNRVSELGMRAAFQGFTLVDNFAKHKAASIFIFDSKVDLSSPRSLLHSRPLGIVSTYNDADIIQQLCMAHIEQGIDLHIIDNWSSDGSFELVSHMAEQIPDRITIERFPNDGPRDVYEWFSILDRKAVFASSYPDRWVLHIDSDELRLSPFEGTKLVDGIALAHLYGSNVLDFAVFNFEPTADGFNANHDPLTNFSSFEFGLHPAHFVQRRAWFQGKDKVELAPSGGHEVEFPGKRVFPYKFPLLHYPIRSSEHGQRKIFAERKGRYSVAERDRYGWHNHYEDYRDSTSFLKSPYGLRRFSANSFRVQYILEMISDVVLQRQKGVHVRSRIERVL